MLCLQCSVSWAGSFSHSSPPTSFRRSRISAQRDPPAPCRRAGPGSAFLQGIRSTSSTNVSNATNVMTRRTKLLDPQTPACALNATKTKHRWPTSTSMACPWIATRAISTARSPRSSADGTARVATGPSKPPKESKGLPCTRLCRARVATIHTNQAKRRFVIATSATRE